MWGLACHLAGESSSKGDSSSWSWGLGLTLQIGWASGLCAASSGERQENLACRLGRVLVPITTESQDPVGRVRIKLVPGDFLQKPKPRKRPDGV